MLLLGWYTRNYTAHLQHIYKVFLLKIKPQSDQVLLPAGNPGLIPGLGRSPGEGNGNPLQYSCLENPMDRGASQATVHGVKKSQTRLNDDTHKYTRDKGYEKQTKWQPRGKISKSIIFKKLYGIDDPVSLTENQERGREEKKMSYKQTCLNACYVASVLSDSFPPRTVARQAPPSMGILQARILEWVVMPSSRDIDLKVPNQ